MLEKTRAIVLNSLKYGESQMIVDMYTEGRGRLSFIQRIPRQGRGGIKKQYFQPLTILDIEFDYRATQRLHKLRSAAVAFPFRSLPFDMAKLSIALFVAEFTIYVTRSEQADPALYAFVENSVRWLDACEGSFANFHIIYMLGCPGGIVLPLWYSKIQSAQEDVWCFSAYVTNAQASYLQRL